jgi:hypothetical protein
MEVENQLAPASPNLPQFAVAETAAMPASQEIDAASKDREEENLQIIIPHEEHLDIDPLFIPLPMLNPATPVENQLAPASPNLPRVAVAESAVMPPLQAIAAAYATDSEEENPQILIPQEERLDLDPIFIPLPMLNQAPPVKAKYKRVRRFRKCGKCGERTHHMANCPN